MFVVPVVLGTVVVLVVFFASSFFTHSSSKLPAKPFFWQVSVAFAFASVVGVVAGAVVPSAAATPATSIARAANPRIFFIVSPPFVRASST